MILCSEIFLSCFFLTKYLSYLIGKADPKETLRSIEDLWLTGGEFSADSVVTFVRGTIRVSNFGCRVIYRSSEDGSGHRSKGTQGVLTKCPPGLTQCPPGLTQSAIGH